MGGHWPLCHQSVQRRCKARTDAGASGLTPGTEATTWVLQYLTRCQKRTLPDLKDLKCPKNDSCRLSSSVGFSFSCTCFGPTFWERIPNMLKLCFLRSSLATSKFTQWTPSFARTTKSLCAGTAAAPKPCKSSSVELTAHVKYIPFPLGSTTVTWRCCVWCPLWRSCTSWIHVWFFGVNFIVLTFNFWRT